MKHNHLHHIFLLGLLLSSLAVAQDLGKPVLFWDVAEAMDKGGYPVVPDKVAGKNLIVNVGKVVDDAQAPGGKALVFDGTQVAPLLSAKTVPQKKSFCVSFDFKPTPVTEWQTLFRYQTDWEFRLNKTTLKFIVWNSSRASIEVNLPFKPEAWNSVIGTVHGMELSLSLNGKTVSEQLPMGIESSGEPQMLCLGGTRTERFYKGSLANIKLFDLE